MKNIFKISILTLFLLTGCSGMLNLHPYVAVSPDAIGPNDIESLRRGMYCTVQETPGRQSYVMFDMMGGNLTTKASKNAIDLINSISTSMGDEVEEQWTGYYKAMMQVNNVYSIALNLAESSTKNKVLGECHYFRAYLHLCLTTRFGDVPLMEKNTDEKVSRTPKNQVMSFIYDELTLAETLLGEPQDGYFYLSKDAATALKARVALYMGNKKEAADLAESLIKNARYGLDSFEKIFRSSTGNGNKETIFAFSCLTSDNSKITISAMFYSYNHPNSGSYAYAPVGEVMNLYSDNDKRKDISVTTLDNLDFINKYPSGQKGTDPVVISRLSEMYLISAEAQGLEKGLARLNELRKFRGLTNIYPASEDKFIDAVLEERRKEFLCEGFRWYDLVRTGRAVEKLGIRPYQTLLPVPASEKKSNENLTQNDGY